MFLASSLLCASPVADAQSRPAAGPAEQGNRPAAAAAAPKVTPITQAVVAAGVLACSSRVDQVTRFLLTGNETAALLFNLNENQAPDRQMVTISMEVKPPDAPPSYATATFSPNAAGGCDAIYEMATVWPKKCAAVRQEQLKELQNSAPLGKSTQVMSLGPRSKVFLTDVPGNQCLAVKKEIVQ